MEKKLAEGSAPVGGAVLKLNDLPVPVARAAVYLELDAPKFMHDRLALRPPVTLWIPKGRIEAGPAGAGRLRYVGPIKMLRRLNTSPAMRTAHFMLEYPGEDQRRSLLGLAALRTIAALRPDLRHGCASMGKPFLDVLDLETDYQLWVNSARHVLPLKKKKSELASLSAEEIPSFVEGWLREVTERSIPGRVQPVLSKGRGAPRLGEFTNAIEEPGPIDFLEAEGTPEWHRVTAGELFKLVWEAPLDDLAKRFGVSRKSVTRKCEKLNLQRPPEGYWKLVAMGHDTEPLLKRHGMTHPFR